MEVPPLPQPEELDIAQKTAKGLLGAVPLVGSVAAEIFDVVVPSQVTGRRDDWLRELRSTVNDHGARLDQIERKPMPWPDEQALSRVKAAFGAASQNLINWPQLIDGQWIERPELALLEEAIATTERGAVALIGPPGAGKSALLARLGCKLSSEGHVLLAIKADMLSRNLGSVADLEREWCLPEPLPILIERLAAESRTVILIDQLDALAPLMDSYSERLSVMLSLVNQLLAIPQVVVVVSCRSFDARHDVRLRSLIHPSRQIELRNPPWESVEPFLLKSGHQPNNWPQATKALLSRPQHLKIFLQSFAPKGSQPGFITLHAMLERVLTERVIEPFGTEAMMALRAVVAAMSRSEELWVPAAPLHDQFPVALQNLFRADLILTDPTGLRISLSHQTLFEFLRGRMFVTQDESLFDEVLSKQDGLAIRPVLWNAIGYLRVTDSSTYRKELCLLIGSPQTRLHISLLLVDFLGTVDAPSIEEAQCLRCLLSNSRMRAHVMQTIERKSEWFTFLRDPVARCNEDGPDAAWQASHVLGSALAFDREFVLSRIESTWLKQSEIDVSTFNIFRDFGDWDDRTAHIIEKIVTRTMIAPTFVCNYAKSMAKLRPDLAAQLVRVKLDVDIATARTSTRPHDQSSVGSSSTDDSSVRLSEEDRGLVPLRNLLNRDGNWYTLTEIAKLCPADLIEAVWTWVEELALLLSRPVHDGFRSYENDWDWHFGGTKSHRSSYLADSLWDAVSMFATADPERFLKWTAQAKRSCAKAIHLLITHGLIAIAKDSPLVGLAYLLEDHRRLAIGGNRGASVLISSIRERIDDTHANSLRGWIEAWEPYDLDNVPANVMDQCRQLAIEKRRALLDLLQPKQSLSACGGGAFELSDDVSEADDTEGGFVESPLSIEQMESMTDEELLEALSRWSNHQAFINTRLGRSYQVAAELQEFAKRRPERALSLLGQPERQLQEAMAGAVIDGLVAGEKVDCTSLCERIHCLLPLFQSKEFRRRAAWALVKLSQRGSGLDEQSINDLVNLLEVGNEVSEQVLEESVEISESRDEPNESVLWGHHGGAFPDGNYPVLLALTLGLLRQDPPARDRWLEILEKHIHQNDSPRVWEALLHNLRFLARCEQRRAIDLVKRIFEKYPLLLPTIEGVRFIASNHFWLPEAFVHHALRRLEESSWSRSAGELLMLRAALVPDDLNAQKRFGGALESLSNGESSSFLFGVIASAAATWMSPKCREASTMVLLAAGPTAEDKVAELIASAFVQHDQEQIPNDASTERILALVAENRALLTTDSTHVIVSRLKELLEKGYAAVAVGRVCKLIIEVSGSKVADMSSRLYAAGSELMDIAVTLQRFPNAKSDGTWIFEQLLAWNAYDAAKTKIALDQRMS